MLWRPFRAMRWVRLNMIRPVVRSVRLMVRDVLGVYRRPSAPAKRKRPAPPLPTDTETPTESVSLGDDGEIIRTQKGGTRL